ncbi:MAG: hypothetical protein JW850_10950 [Thermoflexales bacterium]|nr:hypothetical protein [Thermoflexales bacterium]
MGQYVEPVQLQVVCQQLWESLPDTVSQDGVIEWDEIKGYNVDQALTNFYENTLAETRNRVSGRNPVSERRLRRWFSEQLITPEGRRGLALQGQEETAGLPNAAVTALENHHLIRAEVRGGSRWYELSHDRLVEPIVQSNQAWEAARQTPLRTVAKQWQASQSEGLLYRDKVLNEAVTWAQAHPDDIEEYENDFLQASQQAQQTRHKINRLRKTIIAGLSIGLVVMVALSVWALRQSQIATARQLAAQAQQIQLTDNSPDGAAKSVLLATESMRRAPSAEAVWSMYNEKGLDRLPDMLAKMWLSTLGNMAASPNGKWLAVTGLNTLAVLDTTTWAIALQVFDQNFSSAAFSLDNQWLVTGGQDHIVRIWDTTSWKSIIELEHDDAVNTVAFGPDNQWLAAVSVAGTLRVWQRTTDDWAEIATYHSGPRPQLAPSVERGHCVECRYVG